MKNDSPDVKANAREKEVVWYKYQAIATAGGIPAKRLQWYENWAKQFAKAIRDVPLAERTAEHVQSFLARLSRQLALQPWQVKQAEDAVRLLCRDLLRLSWADPWPELSSSPFESAAPPPLDTTTC